MREITTITNEATQKFRLVGENNERIDFKLHYFPSQQAWYFDLKYESLEIEGMKLVSSPNLLKQWSNQLTFGLSCVTLDGSDPYFIEDFTDGRVNVYLLDENDITEIDGLYY